MKRTVDKQEKNRNDLDINFDNIEKLHAAYDKKMKKSLLIASIVSFISVLQLWFLMKYAGAFDTNWSPVWVFLLLSVDTGLNLFLVFFFFKRVQIK